MSNHVLSVDDVRALTRLRTGVVTDFDIESMIGFVSNSLEDLFGGVEQGFDYFVGDDGHGDVENTFWFDLSPLDKDEVRVFVDDVELGSSDFSVFSDRVELSKFYSRGSKVAVLFVPFLFKEALLYKVSHDLVAGMRESDLEGVVGVPNKDFLLQRFNSALQSFDNVCRAGVVRDGYVFSQGGMF